MLPTADELLQSAQPSAAPAVGPDAPETPAPAPQLPTADELYNKTATDAYESSLIPTLGRIAGNAGAAAKKSFESGDTAIFTQQNRKEAMDKMGIPGRLFDVPAIMFDATVGNLLLRPGSAAIAGWQAGFGSVGEETGSTELGQLGRDIAMIPEALPQGTHGMSVHLPELPDAHFAAEAVVSGAARISEDKYMGTVPMTEQDHAVADMVAQQLPPEAPAPTIHDVVRQDNPELFSEYDNLKTQRENLAEMLRQASETNRQAVEEQSPFQAQIADLTEKMAGASKRSQKINQARIADLREQHDAWMRDNLQPSPEMEQIRSAYNAADYRMRDMSPDVSKAYRTAQDRFPEAEEPEAAPKGLAPADTLQGKQDRLAREAETAKGETKAVLARAASEKAEPEKIVKDIQWASENKRPDIVETLVAKLEDTANKEAVKTHLPEGIAAHVKGELEKAGRPAEEADAAAKLIEEHYKARSARFNGVKGSPEEMYARDSALIKAGKNVTAREFAQGKGRVLKQSANYNRAASQLKSLLTDPTIHDKANFIERAARGELTGVERRRLPNDAIPVIRDLESNYKAPELYQAGDYGLPGFYSKMYRSLDEKLNNTGTPKQMLNQVQSLVKNGAFKKDELFWSGMEDYLKGLPADVKISKAELMHWLDRNKLEVGEHVFNEHSGGPEYDGYSMDDFYSGDEGEPVDVESDDPDRFQEEVDYQTEQFHEEYPDTPAGAKKYFDEEDNHGDLVTESDDPDLLGDHSYEWDKSAVTSEMEQRARNNFDESGDRETTAELGSNRWYIRYNNDTGEWSVSGEHSDSGYSRNYPLEAANDAVREYIMDHDMARYDDDERNESGGVKYESYQEEGPKDDYNEMLITLPAIRDKNVSQHDWPQEAKDDNILMHMRFNTRTDKEGKKVLFMEEMQSDWQQQARKKGTINPEAAAQLEKKISEANHKVGEVEGNKFEYDGDVYDLPVDDNVWYLRDVENARKLGDKDTHGDDLADYEKELLQKYVGAARKLPDEEARKWISDTMEAVASRDALKQEAQKARSGVAAAPFGDLNKYTELGMKRIIGYAAEHGFDKVAWTTGEQQASRWSAALQREVQEIRVSPESTPEGIKIKVLRQGGGNVSDFIAKQVKDATYDDATGYVTMKPADVEHVFGKGIQDEILKRYQELSEGPPKESATDEEIEEAQKHVEESLKRQRESNDGLVERALLEKVSKEAIEKRDALLATRETDSVISGLGLKVNDKGMTEVYDKVMVNTANAIVKKFGQKVKAAEIDLGETKLVLDKPIPEIKEIWAKRDELAKKKADAGLKKFDDKKGEFGVDEEINDKWKSRDEDDLRALDSAVAAHLKGEKAITEIFTSQKRDGARLREMFDMKGEHETAHSQQWSFDLTPELKKSASEGQTLFQGARGKIRLGTQSARAVITLMKDADASTFIHETGHHWLEELMADAEDPHAPADLIADAKTVRAWLGAEGEISTRQHEKFARGFERYMMEGVAPSRTLAGVFAKFKNWLTSIYKTVQKLRAPISDDVRHVYDRLLSANPEKTVLAPDTDAGKMLADLHEADARLAPPELREVTADNIERELDKNLQLHDPEIYDAVKAAESGQDTSEPAPVEDTPAIRGGQSEPAGGQRDKVAKSGDKSEGGGDEQPAASPVSRPSAEPPVSANTQYPADDKFIDKAGNVRLDNIHTTEDIKQIMRDAAARNSDFLEARRNVVSDGKVLDLAEALGVDPSFIDKRKVGEAFNAEQIKYVEKTLAQSTQAVREAMQRFNDSPKTEADAAALNEVMAKHDMIQETFSAVTAESGRALRALKKTQSFWNQGDMELQQFLKNREEGRTLNQLIQQAQLGANLNTPAQLAKFMQSSKKATFKDMILEYYINALISGPITHARYSVGNAINALWTPLVEIPTAAMIGAVKKGKDRVYLGEAGAQMHAMLKGSKDGMYAAVTAFKTGNSPALPGEKLSPHFMNKTNAIPGKIGAALNLPSKSVSAIHSFFKSLRYEQNIQGLAYRQAMSEGLTGQAFINRVSDLSTNPPEPMMTKATADALKELYMTPTEYHSAMGSLTRFTNQSLIAKIIVPFMKIGSQITRNAFVERTPLGVGSSKIRAEFAAGGTASDIQLAKMATGVGLMGTTVLLAAEGLATGDGPNDPEKRRVWLLTHTPNSIQIGGITVPYQGLGHLGMLMRFSANMHETASEWGKEDGGKLALSFMEGINKSVLDENFMRGLKDLLDAVYHPEEYGNNYLKNFATNWLPFSVGLGQVAHKVDPYRRETRDVLDAAWSKIPVLSEGLYPQRDMFGAPIPNGAPIQSYQNDPVVQRMTDLQIGVGKLEKKIGGVQLTPQQYDDYARTAGKLTKVMLNNLVQPGFSSMPQGEQIKMIKLTIEHARETARNMVKFNPANQNIVRQMIENRKALMK